MFKGPILNKIFMVFWGRGGVYNSPPTATLQMMSKMAQKAVNCHKIMNFEFRINRPTRPIFIINNIEKVFITHFRLNLRDGPNIT